MPQRSRHRSDQRHKGAIGGPDTLMCFDPVAGHDETTVGEAHGFLDKSHGVAKVSLSIVVRMTTSAQAVQVKRQIFRRKEVAIGGCSSEDLVMLRNVVQ